MAKDIYRHKANTNGNTGSNGTKHTLGKRGMNGYRRKLGIKKGKSDINGKNPNPPLQR